MEAVNWFLVLQFTLYTSIPKILGKFQCVGTCYSGQLFPKAEDIIKGKHLKGYSYRNITTDDPRKCYSSCINDCRCNACQMEGTRCELLDFDKTAKPSYFVDGSGYEYYDLKQRSYKGIESHMVQPGKCYNGCCRSQPCMNGGACVEHCDSPLEKFVCKCPNSYTGRVCDKPMTMCSDLAKYSSPNNMPENKEYILTRIDNGGKVPVFCNFKAKRSFTLIESFSLANNKLYKRKAFFSDVPRNPNNTNWADYRMSLDSMKYLRARSIFYKATCNFPLSSSSSNQDFFLGRLADFDPLKPASIYGACFKYKQIQVRGHRFKDGYIGLWQAKNEYHLHFDASKPLCGFPTVPHSYSSEDSYGFYDVVNPQFGCTATPQSTTQWWLGEQK